MRREASSVEPEDTKLGVGVPLMGRLMAYRVALALSSSGWLACGVQPPSSPSQPHPAPPANPALVSPASAEPHSVPSAGTGEPAPKPVPALAERGVHFVEDDFDGALGQAEREQKLLFVDAWAEWCHTCRSMRSFVLSDPALQPLAEQVVFAAVDTDKPENAKFLESHEVRVWPSLFAIEPKSKALLGYWPGSASLAELRSFLQESLNAKDALMQSSLDPKSPEAVLIRARQAHAQGDSKAAADLYGQALRLAPPGWSRQSEALHGKLWALAQTRRISECLSFGDANLDVVQGSSLTPFFASILLDCIEHEPDPTRRRRLTERVSRRLLALLDPPPSDMAADDQADAWGTLAEAFAAQGEPQKAADARQRRLEVLERAAAAADSPTAAATFDAGRASAYVALGRGDEAIHLLEGRMRELPDSYEPPARLASVLEALGQPERAVEALDIALKRAYGPRRLMYLAQKARLLGSLARTAEQIATLEAEVAGYRELAAGHVNQERLKAAEARLEQARREQADRSPER